MTSRAPLLGAAALFVVGAAGLLLTLPGRDAGRAFSRFAATESTRPPSPVLPASETPNPTPPVLAAAVAEDALLPTVVAQSVLSTNIQPTSSPSPEIHSMVVAAVASDSEPASTLSPEIHSAVVAAVASDSEKAVEPTPLHVVMVSSGEDEAPPGGLLTSDNAEHSIPAADISPGVVTSSREEGTEPVDSGTAAAEAPVRPGEPAPADGDSRPVDDPSASEHESTGAGGPESVVIPAPH